LPGPEATEFPALRLIVSADGLSVMVEEELEMMLMVSAMAAVERHKVVARVMQIHLAFKVFSF
jgi:hypothetical protein